MIQVQEFFNKEVPADEFAKMLRRYNCEMVRMHLALQTRADEFTNPGIIADAVFWLNEFAETLDPYLNKED